MENFKPDNKETEVKLIKLINPECVSDSEAKNFKIREAARAIVLNENGKIALLNVVNEGYYKLPGGGLEEGENKLIALKRECLEEIGNDIDVINDIGRIIEYRKNSNLKHTSYCYIAKTKRETLQLNLTDEEKGRGSVVEWMSYPESLRAVKESKPTASICSMYIIPRDLAFLEEAKSHLDGINI